MAASLLEAAALSFFALDHSSLKRPPLFIRFHISNPNPPVSHNLPLCPLTKNHPRTKILCFRSCSTAQEVTVETTPEETQEANLKRKLFVLTCLGLSLLLISRISLSNAEPFQTLRFFDFLPIFCHFFLTLVIF